jgi:hypothetical protein
MKRFIPVVVALALGVTTWGAIDFARPATALALSCLGPPAAGVGYAGVVAAFSPPAPIYGAKANIEFVDEHLCTTPGGNDFSAYWVAVTGSLTTFDIY